MAEPEREPNLQQFVTTRCETQTNSMIQRTLELMRCHLGMDVAYINEVHDDHTVVRHLSAAPGAPALRVGEPAPVNAGYCKAMLEGRLPSLIPDTANVPFTQSFDATRTFPIGAYVSAPVKLPDGTTYGTFCCISTKPDGTLTARDQAVVRAFSDLAAHEISNDLEGSKATRRAHERVGAILHDPTPLVMALQPIWDVQRGRPFAVETLARFEMEPYRTPDVWFAEAELAGLRGELELVALNKGLDALDLVPSALSVSVNVSPDTLLLPGFAAALEGRTLDRIIVELTEHSRIDDYPAVRDAIAPWRKRGVRLAVDDAGGGYASLRHILQLRPDIIKSDMTLTRDIHRDRASQSLTTALIAFSHATSAKLIAEGVENEKELFQLQRLGVDFAQGYHLGRPVQPAKLPETLSRGAEAIYPPPDNLAGVRLEPETGAFYEPLSRRIRPSPRQDDRPAKAA